MGQLDQGSFSDLDAEEEQIGSVLQYVSFLIRDELFGFRIEMVQEIIRVPELARVPMTPSTMLGLANLRGEILPVFDLRKMLGVSAPETSDASRVIVVEDKFKVGLVVDRVAQVLNVPEDRIEDAEAIEKTVASELLTGVVKNLGNHDLVQLFDPSRLPDFANLQARGGQPEGGSVIGSSAGSSRGFDAAEGGSEGSDDDVLQIVSLSIGNEEYAFNLTDVDEIVRVPEMISEVPNSPDAVVGLTSLRDRVLPLISLRTCLGVAREEANDSNRVVVLQIPDRDGAVRRFGVIVDRAREVLRISNEFIEDVPDGIKRHGSDEIECICKLDSGKRLISVLSAREIFCGLNLKEEDEALVASTIDVNTEETEEDDMRGAGDEHLSDDEQLVVFKLAQENFGISIHSVQEIIRLPESFVVVPNAGAEVEGLINLRGMVMPVIDMRRYFNLASCERSERQRIIVLNVQGMLTGYIVDSVTEVLTVTASELTAPPTLNSEAARYVQNVAKTHGGKRMVLVLDSGAFDVVDPDELAAAAEEVAAS